MARNLLELLDNLDAVFAHPGILGIDPFLSELRTVVTQKVGYPPRNIIKTGEDTWTLEVALAGFSAHEIEVEEHNGLLNIRGRSSLAERAGQEYIHQGLARRDFDFSIRLGEHVKVSEEYPPLMQNGVLVVNFIREIPEAARPKKFAVKSVTDEGRDEPIHVTEPKNLPGDAE